MSAADDRAAFEAWWDGDVPSDFGPYDIGFKGQAWAAWQAAIAADDTRASVERRKAFMDIERAVAEAVAAEREAAAKVCDEKAARYGTVREGSACAHYRDAAQDCAAAIRARGGAS